MSRCAILVAVAIAAVPVAAPAAAKTQPCKPTQHRVHGKCVARPKQTSAAALKVWSPKVETFYRDAIAKIDTLATALDNYATVQPADFASAVDAAAACDRNLTRDTGATPAGLKSQTAMKQLRQGCSLISTLATEISLMGTALSASQLAEASATLQSAAAHLKAAVISLGLPA